MAQEKRSRKRKIGISFSSHPEDLKKLSAEELKQKFEKKVFPAMIKRAARQVADDDPWYQWSYGFF